VPDREPRDDAGADGAWYSYAIIRIVPRVEREEFLNAGVVLFARTARFLEARAKLDEARLRALAPDVDIARIRSHLDTFCAIALGDASAGEVARLDQSQRFHWLTSPRSTVIQTSPVHIGCSEDPARELADLMRTLVL
jgi:hypothetical protein